jgi:hypothetical protein
MFTFDISYKITNNVDSNLDDTVFEITNDYKSCKWYASDSGPFSNTSNDVSPSSPSQATITRNHGFNVEDAGDLQEIIRKVGESPNLFIDFIVWNENHDCIEIYRSKNFLTHASSDFVALYVMQINNLNGMFKGLHQLCIANETK